MVTKGIMKDGKVNEFVPYGMLLPDDVVEARRERDRVCREQSLQDVVQEIRAERAERRRSLFNIFGRRKKSSHDC